MSAPPGPRWLRPVDAIAACPPMHVGEEPDQPPDRAARTCQRWTLVVVCLASALLLFNVTAPNVALPDIAAGLSAGFTDLQWVLSSYALVLSGLLLAGGALGDRYGRRLLFLAGLAVFALGSGACALAPNPALLVAGRVVQGIGAAALFPAGLALIGAEFSGAARARAIGVWGASVAAAIALGPLLGGLLVAAAGWRAQFAVAAVLAVPAIVVGLRHLRESHADSGRLDVLGTSLLSAALFLAVLILTRGNEWGWTGPEVLGGAVGTVVLLAAFWLVEHRVSSPLISPQLLRNGTFVGATLVALVFAAAGFAPLVYITQYLLLVAGSGPVLAGLQIAPFAAASFVVSLGAAPVAARFGTRATLAGGLVLCAGGLALLWALGPPATTLALLPGLLVFGIGAGVVNPTMTVAALGSVPTAQGGMASGVNNAARQFGIAAGIAGFGALVQSSLTVQVRDGLAGAGTAPDAAERAGQLAGTGDLPGAAAAGGAPLDVVQRTYDAAYGAAVQSVFIAGLAIAVLGAVLVLALIRPVRSP